ncbi:Hypothetical predicted protein [Pelobates cultripes]|uniref:PC-esterase domain containing 1A n=1 Tax=Pelobates cultripes TaxID=61616 RepID=A0AAD1WCJ3_PELCU|nr:Hypothetical predicted protein [Pelobates cultripes]
MHSVPFVWSLNCWKLITPGLSFQTQLRSHDGFVVVLGDSIQRSVYKDLVTFLQHEKYLTESQLKRKGEMTFENDALIEGGNLNEMHNGVDYREVRQYRTGHHLVRFYFLTRVYSTYLESVLSDFKAGPQPDVVIINSCFWDLTRYNFAQMEDYKSNLQMLFCRLNEVLSPECLILWNMTMPVGYKDNDMPEYGKHNLRWDVVEGNFYSASLANLHQIDVLDMHYHFRLDLPSRCRDAIHWNQLAHRKYTQILLSHIAHAWGVEISTKKHIAEMQRPWEAPCPSYQDFGGGSNYFECENGPQSGVFHPGYAGFEDHLSDAHYSFISDNVLLNGRAMPGYLRFDGESRDGPGSNGRNHPFNAIDMSMNGTPHQHLPHVNFGSFPQHRPQPPGLRGQHRFAMKQHFRPRSGWLHPYHRPPPPPARNY